MHGAKMLPPLPDLSRHLVAGRGPANWPNGLCALRPGPGPLAVCAGLCHLVRPAATRARGPPPIAAVTHAAAFIAAALHVAPAAPIAPPAGPPAARRPRRAGSAAVPAIPAK